MNVADGDDVEHRGGALGVAHGLDDGGDESTGFAGQQRTGEVVDGTGLAVHRRLGDAEFRSDVAHGGVGEAVADEAGGGRVERAVECRVRALEEIVGDDVQRCESAGGSFEVVVGAHRHGLTVADSLRRYRLDISTDGLRR